TTSSGPAQHQPPPTGWSAVTTTGGAEPSAGAITRSLRPSKLSTQPSRRPSGDHLGSARPCDRASIAGVMRAVTRSTLSPDPTRPGPTSLHPEPEIAVNGARPPSWTLHVCWSGPPAAPRRPAPHRVPDLPREPALRRSGGLQPSPHAGADRAR